MKPKVTSRMMIIVYFSHSRRAPIIIECLEIPPHSFMIVIVLRDIYVLRIFFSGFIHVAFQFWSQ